MTTLSHTLTLNDTEVITLQRVLLHMISKFDYQASEGMFAPRACDKETCRTIRDKLHHAEVKMTSTSSGCWMDYDGKEEYKIWLNLEDESNKFEK